MISINKINYIKYSAISAFCVFPLAFIAVFFDIEFTDSGFLSGLAYRLSLGQELYKDIDYIRPPLSPLFWSVIVGTAPHEGGEVFIRVFVLIQKIICSASIALIAYRSRKSKTVGWIVFLFSLIFLIHNLSHMIWYTVDGLFFLSISMLLFSHRKYELGFFVALIATLAKQSFVFFPLLYFVGVLCVDRKIAFRLFLVLAAFLFLSWNLFDLQLFLDMSKESLSLADLLRVSIYPHILINFFNISLLLFLVVALYLNNTLVTSLIIGLIFCSPVIDMTLKSLSFFFTNGYFQFFGPEVGDTHHWIFAYLIFAFWRLRELGASSFSDNNVIVSILLCAGAWSSTISWGYNNYLFSAGLILCAILILDTRKQIDVRFLFYFALALSIMFSSLRLVGPYRTDGIFDNPKKMITSGYFKFIYISEMEEKRLINLKNSLEEISNNECVIMYPSTPQFYLFSKREPYLRIDWKIDIEYPSKNFEYQSIMNNNCILILENDDGNIGWSAKGQASTLVPLEHLKKCKSKTTEHLKIYFMNTCDK